jgi:DivIVA domain-containing protein
VSHRRFRRVSRLRKGYHRKQVDSFLDAIQASLGGSATLPSAADVRQAGFEIVHGGYDVVEVDEHLDALEEQVIVAQGTLGGGRRRGRVDPQSEADFLVGELTAPYMQRFPRARILRRGYHPDDVDEFVDRVIATLGAESDPAARVPAPALTVEDVRAAPFRPRRGGYREDAVDEAMDRVVEHLLLVRRQAAVQDEPPLTSSAD